MLKRIIVCLVAGLFFIPVGKAFSNQLLTNGDFEGGIVTGWTQLGPN